MPNGVTSNYNNAGIDTKMHRETKNIFHLSINAVKKYTDSFASSEKNSRHNIHENNHHDASTPIIEAIKFSLDVSNGDWRRQNPFE